MSVGNYVPSWKQTESVQASETPASNDAQSVETPDPGAVAEPEHEQIPESAETSGAEEVSDGEGSDELPIEQLNEYSDQTYQRYAKRFGFSPDEATDPKVRSLLKGKIDSDVYVAQLRTELEAKKAAAQEAANEDEEAQAATTTVDPVKAQQDYEQTLTRFAEAVTAPQMAEAFSKELLTAWGFDVNSKDETTQALLKNAPAMAKTYTKFGINLVNSILPYIIDHAVEQRYPGFNDAWQATEHQRTYEVTRLSDPAFGKLPAYGTAAYAEMMAKVQEVEPDLDKAQFRGRDGRILSERDNLQRRYRIAMKIASGQQVSPQVIQKAVQTGVRKQQTAEKNAQAARVTGAGKSQGNFSAGTKQVGAGIAQRYNEGRVDWNNI
jgi:hypothetical protein